MLPSLPPIVGVVDQGGDGYGAAQAFAAAGKPRPTIIEGNRQDELQWWKEQKEKDGYKTWSASIAPGVSTLAFWVAQQVLDGNKTFRTTCSCPISPSPRTTSRRNCRTFRRAASPATNTRRRTLSPRSRRI